MRKKKSFNLTLSQILHHDQCLFHYPPIPLHEGMGMTVLNLNQQSNRHITLKMYKNNNSDNKKIPPHRSQAFLDGNSEYSLFSFFKGTLQTALRQVKTVHLGQTFRDPPKSIHSHVFFDSFLSFFSQRIQKWTNPY